MDMEESPDCVSFARYGFGSLIVLSNSCSQLGSWHLYSSTFMGNRTFSVGLLRSGISSKSSVVCRSSAVPPHFGQVSIMFGFLGLDAIRHHVLDSSGMWSDR